MEPESDSDGVEMTAETAAPSPAAAAAAPATAAPRNAFSLLGKRPAPPSAEEAAEAKAAAERSGSTKRKAELSGPSFNLAPRKMLVYENRFGSALIANRYRLRNFCAVKRWHLEGKTLELVPANDGAAAADKTQKQASAAAYRNPHAQLVMQIVDDMYGDVPDIVKQLGGDGDHVDPSIINKLVRQRMLYATLEKDPSSSSRRHAASVTVRHPRPSWPSTRWRARRLRRLPRISGTSTSLSR